MAAQDVHNRKVSLVHLFHHTKTGEFLLFLSESSKCDTHSPPFTPRASSATIKNWGKKHIQHARDKKRVKTDSDQSESKEKFVAES